MILTRPDILKAHADGRVVIEPFDPSLVGPNSVDVRLAANYYRMRNTWPVPGQVIFGAKRLDPAYMFGELEKATIDIILEPGDKILAHTVEAIGGVGDVVAMLEGKSTFARRFIQVHMTGGVGDVGYCLPWTLEILNLSNFTQALRVGEPIAQIVFHQGSSSLETGYAGRYQTNRRDWDPVMMLPRVKY